MRASPRDVKKKETRVGGGFALTKDNFLLATE